MKYLLTITLALTSLTVAQDELPGWGVYLGGGLGSVSMEDAEGVTIGFEPALPFIGVTKGVMLGVPLVVSAGIGKRAYNLEMDFMGVTMKTGASFNYIDIAAYMPYPVGPGFAQVGFLLGNPLNTGTMTLDIDGETESEDMKDLDMDPDYGLVLAYGYPVNEKINVNAGYYLGLADHGEEGSSMKFNGLFLFLGYNF